MEKYFETINSLRFLLFEQIPKNNNIYWNSGETWNREYLFDWKIEKNRYI